MENRPETASAKPCSRLVTLVEKSCSRLEIESEKLLSRHETPSEKSVWRTATAGTSTLKPSSVAHGPETSSVKLESVSKVQPSRESLEQVAGHDLRKQLGLSVPQYEPGEWKHELKMSSFTATILNLLFAEAERNGKTRIFRMYIGLGSDGSSAGKLSLDLKFNLWDRGTFRHEWRSMYKTVFTQYDAFESWCTEQSDVWVDDVKTFYHRRRRCVVAVHPYLLAQEDTALFAESAYLSCAKKDALTTHVLLQTCTRTSA